MAKDVEKIILDRLSKNKEIKVSDIVKATGFSRAYINRFIQELKKEGKIILIGKANKARYVLASNEEMVKKDILSANRILKNENLSESAVLEEIKKDTGIFTGLIDNVANIIDYVFTEMLNNAIEHSGSPEITVSLIRNKNLIEFEVVDYGVGIFNNIMQKRKLANEMDAIQDLLKGKQTTDPRKHSGEGIFFASKAGDVIIVQGSGKKIVFDNIVKDIFVKDSPEIKGTRINFKISADSTRKLDGIFREFSGDAFEFSKTKVKVDLFEMDNKYISRSQARRILAGLDKFKEIILDFENIGTIGQGFADEVFRVWKNNHSGKKIEYQNANDNVLFMIKRARENKIN